MDGIRPGGRVIHQMLVAGDDNIIANGGFASSTGWTLGSGWTISGGKAASTGAGSLTQTVPGQVGIAGSYAITFTVSGYSGGSGVYVSLGSTNGTVRSSDGTFTETVAAASFTQVGINPVTGAESFSVESISIRRV